jgi:hypothetical protein
MLQEQQDTITDKNVKYEEVKILEAYTILSIFLGEFSSSLNFIFRRNKSRVQQSLFECVSVLETQTGTIEIRELQILGGGF